MPYLRLWLFTAALALVSQQVVANESNPTPVPPEIGQEGDPTEIDLPHGHGQPLPVACCLVSGACLTTTREDCTEQGGQSLGELATCAPNPCTGNTNEGGVLLLHANPAIEFSSGEPDYLGQSGVSDCSEVITSASGAGAYVIFAIAAFPNGSNPRLSGLTFGLDYDSNELEIAGYGTDADFELPTSSWPLPGEGTALVWTPAEVAPLREVYWFGVYNAYGNPTSLSLSEHPQHGATLADDSAPSNTTSIDCLGVFGFDTPGNTCGCMPVGACCTITNGCIIATEADCTGGGGIYQGDGTNCALAPCTPCTPGTLLYQVDWSGDLDAPVPHSQFGDLVYRVEPGDPPRFLNLLLRTQDGALEDWSVQNLPIYQGPNLSEPLDIRIFFDLEPLGVAEGEPAGCLEYALSLDDTFQATAPGSPVFERTDLTSSEFDAGGGVDSSGTAGSSLERRFYWPDGPPHPPVITVGESRYGEVPNVDESKNACGPGSVTRNILYLAHAESTCVMPDSSIDTGPELIDKMKTYMNYNPNGGVTHKNFLRGKTRLSSEHPELNIYTKFQAPTQRVGGNDYHDNGSKTSALREGTMPDWDWIKSEIDDGEVVEMWVHWLSPSGARTRKGHLVSIIDYWENPQIGQRGILIQQDEGQGNDDGKNEVRSLQWLNAGEDGGEQNHPTVKPFRRNVVDMVVSQSPQVKPTVDSTDCTVRWDTQHPTYQPKKVKIKPGETVRVPGLKQSYKGWTHPKYEEFVWTNDSETTKTWTLYVPDDSRISGGQFQKPKTVEPRHARGAGGTDSDLVILTLHFDGSGWVLDPWDDSALTEQVRFPMIGTGSGSGGSVYAVVDFDLYIANNPLGPAGGAWDLDTTLESLDLDITGGVPAGLSGIWFATAPIEFDSTLSPPFLPETGPAGWLDRSSFEASFGALSVVQEVLIGGDVSSIPTDPDDPINPSDPTVPPVPVQAAVRAYPNPFDDRTIVSFDLPTPGEVTLSVFDVQGRRIDVLANRRFEAGTHRVNWASSSFEQLPIGNYFIRLRTPSDVVTTKVSRIR